MHDRRKLLGYCMKGKHVAVEIRIGAIMNKKTTPAL